MLKTINISQRLSQENQLYQQNQQKLNFGFYLSSISHFSLPILFLGIQKVPNLQFCCLFIKIIQSLEMRSWDKIRQILKQIRKNTMISTPIGKILALNTAMFILWRWNTTTPEFLVKHFSFDRFNIKRKRFHTFITYCFSHFTFISYCCNMIMFVSFGKSILSQFGSKYIWWLYLVGGLSGGLFMQIAKPSSSIPIPQVGAQSSIFSMITFYGLFDIRRKVYFYVFPVRMWAILGVMTLFSLVESSKKSIGGMFSGLVLYQLFRIRVI